jgi:glutathione synthase/RimK-type ligase-like ATP-grasp enzyme
MTQHAELAIFYEHPEWFKPLFATLEQRGLPYLPMQIDQHHFDLDDAPPAPVILSRLAMSSFLRQSEHAIFYSQALYAHWELAGARVINGSAPLAIDASKARQLSLIRSLGLATPATRVVHRREDVLPAAKGLRYPIVVKANIGGSGAGVERYDSVEALTEAVRAGTTPVGVDGVTLVQEYVPTTDQRIVRAETLDGRFLYAISLLSDGATFDLCPADVCMIDKPSVTIEKATLDATTIAAVEAIAKAAQLDVGGIEFMVDARDGVQRFYDINGLSNFVANPREVLGWDPHENLVDYLVAQLARHARRAA